VNLRALATKYHADKLENHSYIDFYENFFPGRDVRKLLEIGIGFEDLMRPFVSEYVHGASLLMWRDYLPNAEIYGIDIREDAMLQAERIHTRVVDQHIATEMDDMWNAWGTDFDVVINDASHITQDQFRTAKAIVPVLKPGAVYIIEDVSEPNMLFTALAPHVLTRRGIDMTVQLFGKRPDDCLVVIQT
jgi:hypothetical protein